MCSIRPLTSVDDWRACIELQRDVWGRESEDTIGAATMHVVAYTGGLVAGAFDPNGAMLGFVLGLAGVRDGEIIHWSHMLAVRDADRNMGVGRKLKEYQRSVLAARGVARIYWTFDPLMAKNAHFNLNRLGARVAEYVPDMYGTTASPLHLGLPTDRLIVYVTTDGRDAPRAALPRQHGLPILTPFAQDGDVTAGLGDVCPTTVLLETPADVLDVIARSRSDARMWRLSVRAEFEWALAHGYTVRGVHRDTTSGRAFYIMAVRDVMHR